MTPEDGSPSTSPDGLVGHPDLDTLADLDAGLLDATAAADAGRHAASCARCRGTLAAFVAVRRDLRALAPPVLPAAVAARLDETVAQLRGSAGPPAAAQVQPPLANPPPPPPPVAISSAVPPRPPLAEPVDLAQPVDLAAAREQRRARARKLTGRVAASVIVAAALVGVGNAILQKSDDGGTVAQSAAVPGESRTGGNDSSGGGSGAGPKVGSEQTKGPETIPSDVQSYDEASLLSAIPAIATRSAVEIITRAGRNGPAGALADTGRRERCTAGIPDSSGLLIAVQRITFRQQTAYVLVYADTSGQRTVIVVSSTCGEAPIPQVLYRHHD